MWLMTLAHGRSETPEQTIQWITTFLEETHGKMDNPLEYYRDQYIGTDQH